MQASALYLNDGLKFQEPKTQNADTARTAHPTRPSIVVLSTIDGHASIQSTKVKDARMQIHFIYAPCAARNVIHGSK